MIPERGLKRNQEDKPKSAQPNVRARMIPERGLKLAMGVCCLRQASVRARMIPERGLKHSSLAGSQ